MSNRRKFSAEFRAEAVELVIQIARGGVLTSPHPAARSRRRGRAGA